MWEPLENQIRGMFILIAFSVRGDTSSELIEKFETARWVGCWALEKG